MPSCTVSVDMLLTTYEFDCNTHKLINC
jgi:hypothetical protein